MVDRLAIIAAGRGQHRNMELPDPTFIETDKYRKAKGEWNSPFAMGKRRGCRGPAG